MLMYLNEGSAYKDMRPGIDYLSPFYRSTTPFGWMKVWWHKTAATPVTVYPLVHFVYTWLTAWRSGLQVEVYMQQLVINTIKQTMKMHWLNRIHVCTQVLLVQIVIYHISHPTQRLGSLKPWSLSFNLKHTSIPKNKVFFHLTTTGTGEYNKQHSMKGYSYNLNSGKTRVFFPGWGQAGHTTAILPSGNDLAVGEWYTAPPHLRSWRWLQRQRTKVILL